jgi:hypothetical protein
MLAYFITYTSLLATYFTIPVAAQSTPTNTLLRTITDSGIPETITNTGGVSIARHVNNIGKNVSTKK